MKKSYSIVLVLVLCIGLLFLFSPVAFQRLIDIPKSLIGATTPAPQQSQQTQTQTLTGAEIGKRVMPFVRGAIRVDGSFYPAYLCQQNRGCSPQESEKPSYAGYAIASLFIYAMRENDTTYKVAADKAVNYALDLCTKDKSTCEFHFRGFQEYYRLTGEKRFLNAMVGTGEAILKRAANPTKQQLASIASNNTVEKLAHLHELTDEVKYMNALKKIADVALASDLSGFGDPIYTEGSLKVDAYGPIIANRILVQAYEATKEKKYLDAAREYLLSAKIETHVDDFRGQGAPIVSSLINSAEALALASTAATDESEKADLKNRAQAILQRFINTNFDSAERPLFDGKNNFVAANETFKRDGTTEFFTANYKTINNNAWIALDFLGIFSDMRFLPYIPR